MDPLQECLKAILQRHFSVVPARTNRHDQWYKRSYQSWKSDHGDQEPLILAPKTSRVEWTRELGTAAMEFARTVNRDAENIHRSQDSTGQIFRNKVFEDEVLDTPLDVLCPGYARYPPLRPVMQRTSYWTESSLQTHEERQIYYRAVKALLLCEQTGPLYHLIQTARGRIRATGTIENSVSYPARRVNIGWQSLIDEILELMISLTILRSFPEALPHEVALEKWVPFVFGSSIDAHNNATTAEKLRILLIQQGNMNPTNDGAQIILSQCHRILPLIQALTFASDLPALDWKQRFVDVFLHYVGFECWNREREGEGYLRCDLNTRKDASWLQKMGEPKVTPSANIQDATIKKQKDPLLMLEPRHDEEPKEEDDAKDRLENLRMLETQEEAYGRKRSTKYCNKARHV